MNHSNVSFWIQSLTVIQIYDFYFYLKNKVESNWKDKTSAITLAASLNLDRIYEDEYEVKRLKIEEKKQKKGLFKPTIAETPDPTFAVSYYAQNYSRDAPNFVNSNMTLLKKLFESD